MPDPRVAIELSAVDKFSGAFNQFTGGLSRIEQKAAGLDSAFARIPFLGTALTGAIGGGAISAAIKGTIDDLDNLAKASQRVGVSVESLSALKYAGDLADVSFEQLSTGLKKLSVNALDAAAGTGDAREAFVALGISVKDAAGNLKPAEGLLAEIADKFAGYEDGATKTALAVKLFGRAGADLIPLLNAGASGLAQMRAEAEQFGVIVSGDAAKAAEQFNDNITRLAKGFEALKIALAGGVLDRLVKVTDAMVAAKKAGFGGFASFTGIGVRGFNESIDDAQANASSNIERLSGELARLQAVQAKYLERGDKALAQAQQGEIDNLQKRIRFYELLLEQNGGNDAAGMLGPVEGGKGKAPGLPDKDGGKGARGVDKLAQFADRVQRERMAEYDKYSREVTQDDLDAQAVKQATDAIKAAEERAKRLQNLYGQTALGKHEALIGNLQFIESLRAAGEITDLQAKAITDDLYGIKEAGEDTFGSLRESIERMGDRAGDAFADMLVDGKASFSGLINAWLKDLARMESRRLFNPLTKAASGALDRVFDGLFGSSLGRMPTPSVSEEFPAFATGGQFTVGGAGGTDSQLVAFRATPGERVTVQTPAQQAMGGGQNFHFSIDARGADAGVAARIEAGVRRAVTLSVQAVAATADRGGSYARAVGRR